MSDEEPRKTEFTREELYELVWAEPMQTLAARWGISDVALKKGCVRMRIPTPHRGYWAKKAVGKSVRRPALPKLPASAHPSDLTAVFTGAPRPVRTAGEEEAEATGPVADQERFEALPENRITVPELLSDPHPLVATAVHLLRKSRTNEQHILIPSGKKLLDLSVSLDTADRAMGIYDALIKALKVRGWSLTVETVTEQERTLHRTVATVREEKIPIAIEERIERTERAPDPKPKYPTYGKQWDYQTTGKLSLFMTLPYGVERVRGRWSDGAKHRVEDHLNDFIVGLVAASEAIKAKRVADEARAREWEAQRKREEAAEKRRQQEAARIRALNADMKAWRRAHNVREYAVALRAAAEAASMMGEESEFAWWVEWVEEYAERIDPLAPAPKPPRDPDPYSYYRSGSNPEEVLW